MSNLGGERSREGMKRSFCLLLSLVGVLLIRVAPADEIRRIALDGSARTQGPGEETGKDGIVRIRKLAEPVLELYPAAAQGGKGTVIIAPGGGYSILAVAHEGREVARWFNSAGWDAVVLLYHVGAGEPTRELALADARAALRLVRTKGADFGLEATRVGLIGFSAGGHLCARLAHETAPGELAFVALIYPAYLDDQGKCREDVWPRSGPVFLYVAGDDKHAPASFAYAKACQEGGIRHEFSHPAQGGHGFGLKPDRPASVQDWPEKLGLFLGGL